MDNWRSGESSKKDWPLHSDSHTSCVWAHTLHFREVGIPLAERKGASNEICNMIQDQKLCDENQLQGVRETQRKGFISHRSRGTRERFLEEPYLN